MQADPDKWDDSELIAAVSRGLENLDAGAAAEDEDEMAAADARFAALREAPVPATTPATAASPVKDPTVGEYGEWEPVQRPAAPPLLRGLARLLHRLLNRLLLLPNIFNNIQYFPILFQFIGDYCIVQLNSTNCEILN